MRLRRCRCGADCVSGKRASFSPLADLLPERTTPELLYLGTRWGALVSYGLAVRMLGDVLPMDRPVSPKRVRRHLQAVAACEEAAMGEEPDGADWAWSGCQRDLDDMLSPDGPAYVGVDGGFVRDRAGSWFEVIAGKSVPGFRRSAPEDEPPRPTKCFAFVQAHDDRPRRRLLDVLAAQGYAPNQKLVLMSDGGESVRRLVARVGPDAEHVLDWFHVTMRLTVLRQMTKGACPADAGWTEQRLRDLEQLKWLLWHGHARQAVDAASDRVVLDLWGTDWDAAVSFPGMRCVRLGLRRYHYGGSLAVELDLARDTYRIFHGPSHCGGLAEAPLAGVAEGLEASSRQAAAAAPVRRMASGRAAAPKPWAAWRTALLILAGALAAVAGATALSVHPQMSSTRASRPLATVPPLRLETTRP